ncbi:predicted protein [Uncinocarpus reesii 1704]|uniref:RBR-type E3 ubiquitin transferase n=1 Tax=Uncinocarpus reesii (strain UAMH 1704) TaxID=336963 RepID=C4JGW9_UNCRE|nr:uncharacterized protein UREG_01220 [Uncinocarpus reesii 1704]EEP76371.1 predicted protein [Uncinocarpus reesii 1704]
MASPQGDDHIDAETADLIIKLQEDDLKELDDLKKGKGRADQLSDADLAQALYLQELQNGAIAFADRRIAQSISSAASSDEEVLQEHAEQETNAIRDREIACRLGGITAGTAQPPQAPERSVEKKLVSKFHTLDIGSSRQGHHEACNEGPSEGSSSRMPANISLVDPKETVVCDVCADSTLGGEAKRLICGHIYCQNCLQRLFMDSTIDESLFPPKCCRQVIDFEEAKPFLSAEQIEFFQGKKKELETANRVYCSSADCSAFISPKTIKHGKAECKICGTITCGFCKAESHEGECLEDPALQEVLRLAKENGWRSCFNCNRIIELRFGCYHIM